MEESIRGENEHYPVTRLIALENTHNRCGGRVLPPSYVDAVGALTQRHGLRLHVDGARLWNAAVALQAPPARLVAAADSVSVCFSKGLGAPVGSAVAGDRAFVGRARRMRKQVGGGMRQAGILAAAALVALDEMMERLIEDHANAKLLARGLAAMPGIALDAAGVETNIVYFDVAAPGWTAGQVSAALAERGVLINATGGRRLRAVTNYHVTQGDVEVVVAALGDLLRAGAGETGRATYLYN
jgi:threonine aldolase